MTDTKELSLQGKVVCGINVTCKMTDLDIVVGVGSQL